MTGVWEMTTAALTSFDAENSWYSLNFTYYENSTNGTTISSSGGGSGGGGGGGGGAGGGGGGGRTDRFTFGQMLLIAFVAGTLSVVTVAGNVMVMVSFKIDKQLQTISNYFLFSLAVADFTVGLVSMPLYTIYTILGYWPLGAHLCDAWLALDYVASNASVLNLLIISFDRYFSVTRPLTYRAKRSPVKAGFMIICAWGISLLLWPPWIYAWPYIEGKRTVPEDDCYIQFIATNQYITFGTAIAAFYVPVTVMCVLYWRIWQETEKRQKDLPNLQGGKQDNSKRSTSSDEQVAVADIDGWARVRSSSNTISADCDIMDTSFSTRALNAHQYNRHRQKVKARFFTWSWFREWCVAWWHSGHEDYELDDYWDDTASEIGVGTPLSGETPLQSSVSRCTSLNVIREPSSTGNIQNRLQDTRALAQRNRLVSSRSVSSDSVYTILIRLPASDCEGAGGEGPSIKMIPEHFSKTAPASLTSRRSEFGNSGQAMSRRPSNLADIRMPLNAKIISKQAVTSKSIIPLKPKPLKKKKKPIEKKADKKAAKTLSAILLAFIITWTPYNILVLLKPVTAFPDYFSKGLWEFFYYLCYINSTINPVCYALCNASFRRTYVRILCCKWKKKHRMAMNRGFYN